MNRLVSRRSSHTPAVPTALGCLLVLLAGAPRRPRAAEAVVLRARTAYLWQTMGGLPETVPIAPDGVSAPLLDPEDLPESNADFEQGRVISTDEVLAQCGSAL